MYSEWTFTVDRNAFTVNLQLIFDPQVTATDGDKDRPQNIVYFLTGQGIDPENPANSKFDINRTTGEIFVLKVCFLFDQYYLIIDILIDDVMSSYNEYYY